MRLPRTLRAFTKMSDSIFACNFEVFGIVQGVFFRKYTQKQAMHLGVTGWCANTRDGSVAGHIEGTKDKLEEMKKWLQFTGSPTSKIDRAVFTELEAKQEYEFKSFDIRH